MGHLVGPDRNDFLTLVYVASEPFLLARYHLVIAENHTDENDQTEDEDDDEDHNPGRQTLVAGSLFGCKAAGAVTRAAQSSVTVFVTVAFGPF